MGTDNQTETALRIGSGLKTSMTNVLQAIPDCSMRPTDLSRRLNVSRVMISRLVNAIDKESSLEVLTRVPGPETLRTIVRSAQSSNVPLADTERASSFIEEFALFIRDEFGTRAALNSALSVETVCARQKLEQSGRYQVFKGMSKILGVECKVWLSCTINTPNKDDPSKLDVSSVIGTSGLRKLRPDVPMLLPVVETPQHWRRNFPGRKRYDIRHLCEHPPAPISPVDASGKVVETFFTPEVGSKDAVYDLFSATYSPQCQNRHLDPEITRRGFSGIAVVPTMTMVSDFIVHKDVYPGLIPELFVYHTHGNGKVHVLDSNWELHRLKTSDKIEYLGSDLSTVQEKLVIADVPGYVDMVNIVCRETGYANEDFRVYRAQIQYPIVGVQYMVAFKLKEKPVEH